MMEARKRASIGGRLARGAALLALLAGTLAQPAMGAGYPERPVRLVVPFNAGSNIDAVARLLAPRISEYLGQQLVIDNRGGASGTIGAAMVAGATPDGYTVLLGNAPTHSIAPNLYKKLPYDPIRDFVPVGRIASSAYVLAVSSTLPVTSVKELIGYAKANPGKLNYGSTGNGTGVHLAGVLFNYKAGVDITHIPYNNVGQLLGDLSTGTVSLSFYPYQGLLPVVQTGKVRLLGTTGAKRASYLPQVPTMMESGLADFDMSAWHGIYAPAGTPPQTVAILYEAVRKAMTDPKVVATLEKSGTDADLAAPAEFAAFTKSQLERYRQVIQLSGTTAE